MRKNRSTVNTQERETENQGRAEKENSLLIMINEYSCIVILQFVEFQDTNNFYICMWWQKSTSAPF